MSDCTNLNKSESRKRRVIGYGSFLIALAFAGKSKTSWVGVPFFFGYLNILQARTRTGVALALTDRDMSEGKIGPVKDRETGWKLKKRAFKLVLGAGALAVVTTVVCRKRSR